MDITAQKRIGVCLRRLRVEQGLNQTAVAEVMDVPQSFVSKVECGEKALRVSDLYDYSEALGLPVDEVVAAIDDALSTRSE